MVNWDNCRRHKQHLLSNNSTTKQSLLTHTQDNWKTGEKWQSLMPCTITSSATGQSFFETLKNTEAFFNLLEDKEDVYACCFEFFLLPEFGYCNTERSHTLWQNRTDRVVNCRQSYSTNIFSIITIFSWFERSVSIPHVHTIKNTNEML